MELRQTLVGSDDETTPTETTVNPRRSRLLSTLAFGTAMTVAVLILSTRGRFVQLLTEFELPVSRITSFALGPVLPILLGLLGLLTLVREFVKVSRPVADLWNAGVLVFAIGCLSIYAVGIFAPLLALVESLS